MINPSNDFERFLANNLGFFEDYDPKLGECQVPL